MCIILYIGKTNTGIKIDVILSSVIAVVLLPPRTHGLAYPHGSIRYKSDLRRWLEGKRATVPCERGDTSVSSLVAASLSESIARTTFC